MSVVEDRARAVPAGQQRAHREREATAGQRCGAVVLDALMVLLVTSAAAAIAVVTERNAAGTTLLVLVAALVSAGGWLWCRWQLGSSPAHAVLGLRTVDGVTCMPGRPLRAGRRTLRVRGAVDPLRLRARPLTLGDVSEGAPLWFAAKGLLLVFDDGSRYILRHAAVVGRDPSLDPARYLQLAVPDLSRTMARSHVLLRMDGEAVTVTDLGDAAGTWVVARGREYKLAPGSSQRVPFGCHLRLGARYVALYRRGGAEHRVNRPAGAGHDAAGPDGPAQQARDPAQQRRGQQGA